MNDAAQHGLFADKIEVANNMPNVCGLRYKKSFHLLRILFCLFIWIFRRLSALICIYVFSSHVSIEKDYSHP